MTTEPYRSARRVFWIADNCSSHRGDKAAARLRAHWPTLTLVHTPVHASWLNPVEIYFSIVQRKVVTPNDFTSLRQLEERLLAFQVRYEQTAKPFQWCRSPKWHPADTLNAPPSCKPLRHVGTFPRDTVTNTIGGNRATLHAGSTDVDMSTQTLRSTENVRRRVVRSDGEVHPVLRTPSQDLPTAVGRVVAGRVLLEGEMSPRPMIVDEIGGQEPSKVRLAEYDHMVQALSPD
jgi:hypothetical protein